MVLKMDQNKKIMNKRQHIKGDSKIKANINNNNAKTITTTQNKKVDENN